MIVTIPPFDIVKVRQAVNMAFNNDRIVKLINNRGVPAPQALPPPNGGRGEIFSGGVPDSTRRGHRPRGCPN